MLLKMLRDKMWLAFKCIVRKYFFQILYISFQMLNLQFSFLFEVNTLKK